ncbi:MAG TPA: hypothetical protein VFF20_01545 [Pseudogracilibacillus sp.]|nr:hypothetical protein [Pseudogracilibacillus sp.]
MIQAVLMIGAILSAIVLVVSVVLVKVTPKNSYIAYFPGFIFFGAGLILLLFATLFDRIKLMNMEAGLGGWGIACLFAAAISMIVAAIIDAYRQGETA